MKINERRNDGDLTGIETLPDPKDLLTVVDELTGTPWRVARDGDAVWVEAHGGDKSLFRLPDWLPLEKKMAIADFVASAPVWLGELIVGNAWQAAELGRVRGDLDATRARLEHTESVLDAIRSWLDDIERRSGQRAVQAETWEEGERYNGMASAVAEIRGELGTRSASGQSDAGGETKSGNHPHRG
jgi:hypothetical protein